MPINDSVIKRFETDALPLGLMPVVDPAAGDFVGQRGDRILDPVAQVHAERLKLDPSLRTLTEVVRNGEDWQRVAPFVSRGDEFREGYSGPNRVVAPMVAGIVFQHPELVDLALAQKAARDRRPILAEIGIDSPKIKYVPTVILGAGPQGQIISSAIRQRSAAVGDTTLITEVHPDDGGTFRASAEGSFHINNRTRPQVSGARPIPGSRSNLSDLMPGVITPADTTNDAYITARDLGRATAVNHAFDSNIAHQTEAVRYMENIAPRPEMPGRLLIEVKDLVTGTSKMVNSDILLGPIGLKNPDLASFTDDEVTQKLVAKEQEVNEAGGRARILSLGQLMQMLNSPDSDFPLRDFRNIAFIGDRDSAAVGVGTVLGYQPREDNSVTQLDWVENVYWFGQSAGDLEEYVENNRILYAKNALDFPRDDAPDRFSRITPIPERATNIRDKGNGLYLGDEEGNYNEFVDLVVVCAGFEGRADVDLAEMWKQPLDGNVKSKIASNLAERANGTERTDKLPMLETGDIVEYPTGHSLRGFQVLGVEKIDGRSDFRYNLQIVSSDGRYIEQTVKETKGRISLLDLMPVDIFTDSEAIRPEVTRIVERGYKVLDGTRLITDFERRSRVIQEITRNAAVGNRATCIDFTSGEWRSIDPDGDLIYSVKKRLINLGSTSLRNFGSDRLVLTNALDSGIVIIDNMPDPEELLEMEMTPENVNSILSYETLQPGSVLVGKEDNVWSLALVTNIASNGSINVVFAQPGKGFQRRKYASQTDLKNVLAEQSKAVFMPDSEFEKSTNIQETGQVVFTANEIRRKSVSELREIITPGQLIMLITGQLIQVDDTFSSSTFVGISTITIGSRGIEKTGTSRASYKNLSTLADLILPADVPQLTDNASPRAGISAVTETVKRKQFGPVGTTFMSSGARGKVAAFIYAGTTSDGRVRILKIGRNVNTGVVELPPADVAKLVTKNRIDTVLFPGDESIIAQKVGAIRIEDSRSAEVDNDASAIARRIGKLPVFAVGPAGRLKADPNLVSLVPTIPENSDGILTNADRSRIVGNQVARIMIGKLSQVEASKLADFRVQPRLPFIRYASTGVKKEKPVVIHDHLEEPVRMGRNLSPVEALTFGLGEAVRNTGWIMANERGGNYVAKLGKIKFKVTNTDDGLIINEETNLADVAQNTRILAEPVVQTALERLTISGKIVEIEMVLDARGLDMSQLKINIVKPKSKKSRSLPKLPAKN